MAACGDAAREDAAKEGGLAPGSTFRDCDWCPEMVVIPGGSFVMGSPPKEPMAFPHEQPQRAVTVKPFALGVYEVSFAEWELCVNAGGCGGYMPRDRKDSTPDRPAETLSYNDAQAFVDWLNEQVDGAPYRLPSEAEWEYAARAGTTTAFWWGDAIGPENANYRADELYRGGGSTGEALGKSVPVKSFAPNPFGLYQMNGNVAEWTSDCWHWRYESAPTDGSPWMAEDGGDCDKAHFRGGTYIDRPDLLRSASRYSVPRHQRWGFIGMRVAKTLRE